MHDTIVGQKIVPAVRIKRITLISVIISLVISFLLASLPVYIFPDRMNYINYATWRSWELWNIHLEAGIFSLIFNEPAWLLLNMSFGKALGAELFIRLLIFFPAFLIYFLGVRDSGRLWPLFLIFTIIPPFLSNHLHHLRFALALSLFIIAARKPDGAMRFYLALLAGLFHTAFIAFFAVFVLREVMLKLQNRASILLIFGLFVSLLPNLMRYMEGLPIRQLDRYGDSAINVGGGMFFVFLVIIILFAMEGRTFLRDHALAALFTCMYLGLYWVFPYSRRFLDAGIWFIIIAGLKLSGFRKGGFIAVYGVVIIDFLLRRASGAFLGYAAEEFA